MKNLFRTRNLIARGVAVAVFASTSAVFAGEDIAVSELPPAVNKAVTERFPKAELIKAEKETEKGELKYEVKVRHEGKLMEADVSPDGKILKVESGD